MAVLRPNLPILAPLPRRTRLQRLPPLRDAYHFLCSQVKVDHLKRNRTEGKRGETKTFNATQNDRGRRKTMLISSLPWVPAHCAHCADAVVCAPHHSPLLSPVVAF